MQNQDQKLNPSRRAFLRGSLAVGASTTLVAAAPALASDLEPSAVIPETSPSKQGYQLTPHIKAYYQTAMY